MRHFISVFALLLAICSCSSGKTGSQSGDSVVTASDTSSYPENTLQNVYFNDEENDTAKIASILRKVKDISGWNDRIIAITQEFIGTPYVGHTLNVPTEEMLYINTTALDCTTFVETVIALSLAAESKNAGVDDFAKNLQSIRYRNGLIDGYPSRLHYISEWAIDNAKRGNFNEITGNSPLAETRVKTINYMTQNRQQYPALENEDVFLAIEENEKNLKDLKFALIPTSEVDNAASDFLKSGDIAAIVTDKKGLDVSHIGVINIKDGIPYLIHASSKYNKVVNDTVPLASYLKRQGSPGIRVFRREV